MEKNQEKFNSEPLILRPKNSRTLYPKKHKIYPLLFAYGLFLLLTGFILSDYPELFTQLKIIFTSPSPLITDYIALGGLGAAFVNGGMMTLFVVGISFWQKIPITGPLMAAFFMISGFSFFGKNIVNSLPLLLGTYLFSIHQKRSFQSYALVAFFGSSLSPVVSMLAFSGKFPLGVGLFLGYLTGIIIGFILPPLATHFQSFTQGFNLYNVGFTCGMISMLLTGIFRMFGWEITNNHVISHNSHDFLLKMLIIFSLVLLILGIFYCLQDKSFHLITLFKSSGKIMTDFVTLQGLGSTLINMGLMGFLTIGYLLLMKGQLNGPVLGAVISVIGFSAYGNHPFNSVPVLLGVYLGGMVNIYDMNATSFLLAALFSTTLGPISGFYGAPFGILAGFFHIALVTNVGYLHGGLNLYNNGFSGGFIAALMVPVLDSLKLGKEHKRLGRALKSKKNSR